MDGSTLMGILWDIFQYTATGYVILKWFICHIYRIYIYMGGSINDGTPTAGWFLYNGKTYRTG